MAQRIEKAVGGDLNGKVIGVLGVTFKPNTDDMRDAPSLTILPMLSERGATIQAYDPQSDAHAKELLPEVTWKATAMDALEGADALVVLTEWNEFRALNLTEVRAIMRGDVILDLRNIFRPEMAREAGFRYSSVGRQDASSKLKVVRGAA